MGTKWSFGEVKQDKGSRNLYGDGNGSIAWNKEIPRAANCIQEALPLLSFIRDQVWGVRRGMSSFSTETATVGMEPPHVGLKPGSSTS